MVYHVPALLDESINGLNIRPTGIYVDVTFGGGGHSRKILEKLTTGRLIAFDQDEDAAGNVIDDGRFTFLGQNFRFLKNNLQYLGIARVDGILADLGVSFHQFDEPSRGFTFRHDTDLDMRMSRNSAIKASDLLGSLEEEKLAEIFFRYGEMNNSRKIARLIVKSRISGPVKTVNGLTEILRTLVPRGQENKFYAKLFQALRIAVNHELDYLKEMLLQSLDVLESGGRLVVLTYHSLEDRIVKDFMRTGNFRGEEEKDFYGNVITPFRLISRKAITPAEEEIMTNSRSRSAKLRIAEKI
ncbi:MAG TPA: 16S rRNA (cytosine(1402)-N(4))-methyltransferase RsmH [Bacteroidales bacterium]|nr:16S rRNA (cytosine(1402)-N(4))-methyltransferase RsmH [Bacteroidales bacterium]